MDMNLLGETLAIKNGNTYYGFWMQAGGNNGVAAAEVFYSTPANGFEVHLETKSSDDDGQIQTTVPATDTRSWAKEEQQARMLHIRWVPDNISRILPLLHNQKGL